MITDADLRAAGLRKNPFSLLPDEGIEVWAGRDRLKSRLLDVVNSVRNDHVGLSEFVILHGPYGAGKSHALRYLQSLISNREKAQFQSPAVYLPNVRTAEKVSFLDVYCAIIPRVGRSELVGMATAVIEAVKRRHDDLYRSLNADELRERGADERTWRRAKQEVLGQYADRFDLLDSLGRNEDDAWFYISCADTKVGPTQLTKLGVPGALSSGFDAAVALGMLINVGCRTPLTDGRPHWKAFYLLVDEFERLLDLQSGSVLMINAGFRDLLNQCPENFCLMFAFSGEAADVQTVVEQGLFDRLTRSPPFSLTTLDTDEAVGFIRDVIAFYRGATPPPTPWHPFTEEGIRHIVEETTDKTPRKLFRACRIVLDKAATAGVLRQGRVIDKDLTADYLVSDEE